MVLTFSLVDSMQKRSPAGFDYRAYWRHAVTGAVAARMLAEALGCQFADEAFVTGLLCDIGVLAAYQADSQLYTTVLEKAQESHQPVVAAEEHVLGLTHERISGEMMQGWGLPPAMIAVVLAHHGLLPPKPPESPGLTEVVQAAARIAELFCTEDAPARLEALKQEICAGLALEDSRLDQILKDIDQYVRELANLFSVDIGPTRSYQQLQAQAVVLLAKLSVTAEMERSQLALREQNARAELEELSDQNRTLAHKASTDGLTGICNRPALEQQLVSVCRLVEAGTELGVLLLDIDRFKRLNDTFGHQAGDTALRLVGEFLRGLKFPDVFCARYGGEEFAILVPGITSHDLQNFAEDIRLGIRQIQIPQADRTIHITVSIGATHVGRDVTPVSPHDLVQMVDRCLYQAKQGGRNRVIFTEAPRKPAP